MLHKHITFYYYCVLNKNSVDSHTHTHSRRLPCYCCVSCMCTDLLLLLFFRPGYFVHYYLDRNKLDKRAFCAVAIHDSRAAEVENTLTHTRTQREQNEKLKDNILFWCTTTAQLNDYSVLRGFVYLLFSLIK